MGPNTADGGMNPSFTLPGFEPLEKLGIGGFGSVWKARQDKIGRLVAIKVGHGVLTEPEDQRFFDRECESLGRLSGNRNIVQVYTAGYLDDARPYLVLEYIDGGSLTQKIKQNPLSEQQVIQMGADLCNGLAEAHQAGVLHRDIKPDNVLMRGDGTAVLADFGIAQLLDSTRSHAGTLVGSLRYMAPEVLRGNPPSPTSDVYGIGITLYAAMIRKQPFLGESNLVDQVMHRVFNDQPQSVIEVGYSKAMNSFIRRLLAKKPEDRFDSAASVAKQLESVEASAAPDPEADRHTAVQVRNPTKVMEPPKVERTKIQPQQFERKSPPANPGKQDGESQPPTTSQGGEPGQPASDRFEPKEQAKNRRPLPTQPPPVGDKPITAPTRPRAPTSRPAPAPPASNRAENNSHVSVLFGDTEFSSPATLATALARQWDVAIRELSHRPARFFCQELSKAAVVWKRTHVQALINQFPTATTTQRHYLLTDLLIDLDPKQDPTYRGWKIGNRHRAESIPKMYPQLIEEIRQNQILIRWRRHPDMENIVQTTRRWEDLIAEYDHKNSVLQVADPTIRGRLLLAAPDEGAETRLRQTLRSEPNHSAAARQSWWSELFGAKSVPSLLLAQSTMQTAADQTEALINAEQAAEKKRLRTRFVTGAVAVLALIISIWAAQNWRAGGSNDLQRLVEPSWVMTLSIPFVAFWVLLGRSNNRGAVAGGCLGSLAWLGWAAAVGAVGLVLAMADSLNPTSSTFGLFLAIATVTVPLAAWLAYLAQTRHGQKPPKELRS